MKSVDVHLRSGEWLWSAEWPEIGMALGDATAHLQVDQTRFHLRPAGGGIRQKVEDALGRAVEISRPLHAPGLSLQVHLRLLLYEEQGLVALQAQIINAGDHPGALGDLELFTSGRADMGANGRNLRAWVERSPGHPSVEPLFSEEKGGLTVDSQGMLTLAGPQGPAFTVGFISPAHHRPVVRLSYAPGTDEILLTAAARFNGRQIKPGEQVQTGWLVLRADAHPLAALEAYGDLLTGISPPRRTPPPIGWCSWYAIRLPISHAFTLANAQVVTERFRDLGMDLMLLDHGWQIGDICGDWDHDPQDFPGGLEALARDLRDMGLKLGLWIAPTDIARTSRLFGEHPDWMLRDAQGRPATTWRWYWDPHPLQCQLDATQQPAYEYVADAFRRLVRAGASYFKIDFIAGCSGESLYPKEPGWARGWDPLQRAMQAVREGAGPQAYVRYCQTPPLLSTGLADGVYSTNDTLDAGGSTWPTLREVFRMSAAQFWVNRLYVHEACDLSVRAQGNTEECRLRATMLVLSGSSIMFSDDMTRLPEERIRLMQQCMPALAEAARPLNLFAADMPDQWHLRAEQAGLRWELLALFNFAESQKEVEVHWEDLGLSAGARHLVREFWTGACEGVCTDAARLVVPGLSARLYSFWPALDHPHFAGTDLHLSQGLAELQSLAWEEGKGRLSGMLKRAPGIQGHAYFRVPEGWQVTSASHPLRRQNGGLWAMPVEFETAERAWEIRAERG